MTAGSVEVYIQLRAGCAVFFSHWACFYAAILWRRYRMRVSVQRQLDEYRARQALEAIPSVGTAFTMWCCHCLGKGKSNAAMCHAPPWASACCASCPS